MDPITVALTAISSALLESAMDVAVQEGIEERVLEHETQAARQAAIELTIKTAENAETARLIIDSLAESIKPETRKAFEDVLKNTPSLSSQPGIEMLADCCERHLAYRRGVNPRLPEVQRQEIDVVLSSLVENLRLCLLDQPTFKKFGTNTEILRTERQQLSVFEANLDVSRQVLNAIQELVDIQKLQLSGPAPTIDLSSEDDAAKINPMLAQSDQMIAEPRPDAGWFTATVINAPLHKMYALSTIRDRDIPFNPDMTWGLCRGSYVGLLISTVRDQNVTGLVHVEQTLYDLAQRGNNQAAALPRRWWLRLHWQDRVNGPNTIQEIWEAVEDSPHKNYLQNHGLSDNHLLGFILMVDLTAEQDNRRLVNTLWQWIYMTFTRIFPGRETAFVIHFFHPELSKAHHIAELLASQPVWHAQARHVAPLAVPFETFFSLPTDVSITDERATLAHLRHSSHHGESFCRFFEYLIADNTEDTQRQGWRYAKFILPLYRAKISDIPETEGPERNFESLGNLIDVVRDLDQMATVVASYPEDTTLDQQMLEMVRDYRPLLLYNIISAYTYSERPAAQLTALVFACDPGFDTHPNRRTSGTLQLGSQILIDAWLVGAYRNELLKSDLDLRLRQNQPSLAIPLLLALLRFGQRENRLVDMLRQFKRLVLGDVLDDPEVDFEDDLAFLPSALQDIVLLINNLQSAETFWEKARNDEERILYLARSGVHTSPPPDLDTYARIDWPEFWWWIQSLNPTMELFEGLLRLPVTMRAVLGLITPAEWKNIQFDTSLIMQLLLCRRQRKVFFAN